MIANFPVWGKVSDLPMFEYTGTYEYIDDGSGNWRIKFLTSGTFKPLKNMAIDAFLVGGGGGGGTKPTESSVAASSGGGGGFTKTVSAVNLTKNTTYEIAVGVGGAPEVDGGSTTAFNETAVGGKKGSSLTGAKRSVKGGSGGSGGGGATTSSDGSAGSGGSDGSNGSPTSGAGAGGTGQGTTTREFGESTGDLYSGGGGGTYYMRGSKKIYADGGNGGGAKGGESAADNTGGGGGGYGGYGGSGIVVIRNARAA